MTLQYINEDGVHYHDIRSNLYWNKYVYRAKIRVPHGNRMVPGQTLSRFLDKINYYWLSTSTREYLKNNPDVYELYHGWRNNNAGHDLQFRSSGGGYVHVYCNELAPLHALEVVSPGTWTVVKAVINRRSSTVKLFKNKPKHNFRIYLRTVRIRGEAMEKFFDWLKQRSDKFHMSPALTALSKHPDLSGRNRWLSSSYFIDYDVESLDYLLHLTWSEYLGKHYKLRQHGVLIDSEGNLVEE